MQEDRGSIIAMQCNALSPYFEYGSFLQLLAAFPSTSEDASRLYIDFHLLIHIFLSLLFTKRRKEPSRQRQSIEDLKDNDDVDVDVDDVDDGGDDEVG